MKVLQVWNDMRVINDRIFIWNMNSLFKEDTSVNSKIFKY